MLLSCDKLDSKNMFTLTVVFKKHLDASYFKRSLERISGVIKGRKTECFLFLGDPSIPSFSEESFDIDIISETVSLIKDSKVMSNTIFEVYSSLRITEEECNKLKCLLDSVGSDWAISTVFNTRNDVVSFIKNAKFFYDLNKLRNINCFTPTLADTLSCSNVRLLSNIFKDIQVKMISPKITEYSKYLDITHRLKYSDGSSKLVSFREFDNLDVNFYMFNCDISNHLEIDLGGCLYSCSTALEAGDTICDGVDIGSLVENFKCPYHRCKHNDNMSTCFVL